MSDQIVKIVGEIGPNPPSLEVTYHDVEEIKVESFSGHPHQESYRTVFYYYSSGRDRFRVQKMNFGMLESESSVNWFRFVIHLLNPTQKQINEAKARVLAGLEDCVKSYRDYGHKILLDLQYLKSKDVSYTPSLDFTIDLVIQAFKGKVDKGGNPYIFHLMRVAENFQIPEFQTIALLHDLIEDTDFSLDDLRAFGYPEDILLAVDCLTKRKGEPYDAYLLRIKRNELAKSVKIADLQHNLSLRRLNRASLKDFERVEKYQRALEFLLDLNKPENERG